MAHQRYKAEIEDSTFEIYGVAFDGCHKIYLLMSEEDIADAKDVGYDIYSPESLDKIWRDSCFLRFIQRWDTLDNIIEQGWMPTGIDSSDMLTEDQFAEQCENHPQFSKEDDMFVPKIEVTKL